ncbi:hypothetical protein SEA_MAGRITTE_196 [Microbacterium phage Magritte]|nr:hypothetical protein SEA_MAGRITTE_196 [Microbacterium phage Magritte]
MGWFSKGPKPLAEAPTVDPDFKAKNAARIEMERRAAWRDDVREEATLAVRQAQNWLDTHPKTHSARKGDVKALIRAVEHLMEID